MNIHGCQPHPKVAIYVVKQLKNDSFRQGLYIQNEVLGPIIRFSQIPRIFMPNFIRIAMILHANT